LLGQEEQHSHKMTSSEKSPGKDNMDKPNSLERLIVDVKKMIKEKGKKHALRPKTWQYMLDTYPEANIKDAKVCGYNMVCVKLLPAFLDLLNQLA
jgi:hypothetical protein